MDSLAIIPARGGSKRILRKNIKQFIGKPIIAYSIEAALNSGLFKEVFVSTDDSEIASVALFYGAKVPVLRSESNSNDFSTLGNVVREVLDFYKKNEDYVPSVISTILPTAPFLTAEILRSAFSDMNAGLADSIISVGLFSSPIFRSLKIDSNGYLVPNFPQYFNVRSQDLPPSYYDAGQFYFTRVQKFEEYNKLSAGMCLPYILPDGMVQDIDTIDDWNTAELKYRTLYGN